MANLRGVSFVVLLVTLTAACDDGGPTAPTPVTPTPVTPMEPEEITITVVALYPIGDAISGVTVVCTAGCGDPQTQVTNSQGEVILTGHYPLMVRAEKRGYIPAEQQVTGQNRGRVYLSHEWPSESAASFRRLTLHPDLKLVWGEEGQTLFPGEHWGGYYDDRIKAVVVAYYPVRRRMLKIMEHELRHAHQDQVSGSTTWRNTNEGKQWLAAMGEDYKTPYRLPWLDENYEHKPWENEAEFYAWWIRSTGDGLDPNNHSGGKLCVIAKARCRYFEGIYGPRPGSYP